MGFTKRSWGTVGQTPQTGGFQKRTWGTPQGGQQGQFNSDLWSLNVKFAKYTQNGC